MIWSLVFHDYHWLLKKIVVNEWNYDHYLLLCLSHFDNEMLLTRYRKKWKFINLSSQLDCKISSSNESNKYI